MNAVIDIIRHRPRMNAELAAWIMRLRSWRYDVRELRCQYDVCTARRQSLARFIDVDVPAGATHLVMVDDDMVPASSTDQILSAPGDLAYCGYAGRGGKHGHYGDGDFGCGCCRISADLADKIDVAASFDFGFDATRTRIEQCECRVFADQAKRLGYESKMVGVIGHLVSAVIMPVDRDNYVHRWPAGE